jgi:phosphopentomutase
MSRRAFVVVLDACGVGALPLRGVAPSPAPVVHGRLHALGPGKDSTAGHWELMGVVASAPAPTYLDGFPPEVVERVRAAAGRDTIGHVPSEGLATLDRWGAEHLRGGGLIVYTSADSVLQSPHTRTYFRSTTCTRRARGCAR